MAESVTGVCNRSLLMIGARATIASLNEGSVEANACSILYTPTYEMLARAAHWNCFRKQASLSLLASAPNTPENPNGLITPYPPNPWLYMYQLPSDCLDARFLLPAPDYANVAGSGPYGPAFIASQSYVPDEGQIPYVVAYSTDASNNPIKVLLTNLSQAELVYTVNLPDPANWDSMFQQAMVSSLAAFLVPALSLNIELVKLSAATAQSIIDKARIADGNEGVTVLDHMPDWIRARAGGYGYSAGPTYNNYGTFGYQNIQWPGGF